MEYPKCPVCGIPVFSASGRRKVFCSKQCSAKNRRDNWSEERRQRQRDASSKSLKKKRDSTQSIKCKQCGKKLPVGSYKNKLFCDQRCRNAWSMVKKYSERLEYSHRYRARKRSAETLSVSDRDWEKLKIRFNFRCAYCGKRLPLGMDHIVPLSRDGRHSIGNILPCCQPCNASKRDRFLIEWKRARRHGSLGYIV